VLFNPEENQEFSKKFLEFLESLENLEKLITNSNHTFEYIKKRSNTHTQCNRILISLNQISLKHNIYWDLCNIDVYKNTFDKRLKKFLIKNVDSNKNNFISLEILNSIDIGNDIIKKYSFSGAIYLLNNRLEYLKQLLNTKEHSNNNHNPSLWNEKCFMFFEYLIENYYTKKKRELTDIWHFLTRDLNEEGYQFYATQNQYKKYIKKKLGIEIKNWQQSNFEYDEKYKPKLKSFFTKFNSNKGNNVN
jgi:hypothetical protein